MIVRDRVRELRRVKASELQPSPSNWRVHPEAQANALRGALAEIGFASAVLARELEDGSLQLIDGHLRAETLPDMEIPVLVLDLDEAEANLLLASFDPLGAMATADAAKLDALLREVNTGNEELAGMIAELAKDNGVIPGVEPTDLPQLPDGDKKPFQNLTFTLADSQAELVKRALGRAKDDGGDTSDVNENSNGNALAFIAEKYLG